MPAASGLQVAQGATVSPTTKKFSRDHFLGEKHKTVYIKCGRKGSKNTLTRTVWLVSRKDQMDETFH